MLKIKPIYTRTFFLLCVILIFSGCSVSKFESGDLMRPPRLDGNFGKIQMKIEKECGDDVLFKYPKSGDYRSSIVLKDINGDGNDEAIAIYKKNTSERSICLDILSEVNGDWIRSRGFISNYDDVDKICFADIDGDGKNEIIIGWSNNLDDCQNHITVYDWRDIGVKEVILNDSYMDLDLIDIDDDGIKEIFIVQNKISDENKTEIKLLKLEGDQQDLNFCEISSIALNASLQDVHITEGMLEGERHSVILTSKIDKHSKNVSLVYWDPDQKILRNPIEENNSFMSTYYSPFLSKFQIYPKDINNDGKLEIPYITYLNYSDNSSDELSNPCYLCWYSYNVLNGETKCVSNLIYNPAEKYTIALHDKWIKDMYGFKIFVSINQENQSMVFSERVLDEKGGYSAGENLFTITAFSEKEWQLNKSNKFFEVYNGDGLVFAITQINLENELSISEEEIASSFNKIDN